VKGDGRHCSGEKNAVSFVVVENRVIETMMRQVHASVQKAYSKYASEGKFEDDWENNLRRLGYGRQEIEKIPSTNMLRAECGAGNPFKMGMPSPGDWVVDLGCGAGVDSIIAASCVGPSGCVTGIDMTEGMIHAARDNVKAARKTNPISGKVEFHVAKFDDPKDDKTRRILQHTRGKASLVISNGAFNLSPNKRAAFQLAYEMLAPGARFQFSDVVVVPKTTEGA